MGHILKQILKQCEMHKLETECINIGGTLKLVIRS